MNTNPISQSDAVLATTKSVLGDRYDPSVPVASIATDADRLAVAELLIEGFEQGEINLSAEAREKFQSRRELKKYVSGLISNWWKKNPDLNGGGKYEPKSQRVTNSAQIKNIMLLRERCSESGNEDGVAQCDAMIAKIKAEAEVKKEKAIDVEKLPEELRGLLKTA